MSEKNKTPKYLRLSSGDVVAVNLIGMCSHYSGHGVMVLNHNGEKLLWIPEPNDDKAKAIRDEIADVLVPND